MRESPRLMASQYPSPSTSAITTPARVVPAPAPAPGGSIATRRREAVTAVCTSSMVRLSRPASAANSSMTAALAISPAL